LTPKKPQMVPLMAVALLFALFFLLSCSDVPLSPAPSAWVKLATFPDPHFVPAGLACRSDGIVFIAGTSTAEYPAAIYKFGNGALVEDFTAPYEDSDFKGTGFFGTVGWAVGNKRPEDISIPYMVYNDGADWTEVPVEYEPTDSLFAVFPINETDCWLLKRTGPGGENVFVIKYSNGDWTTYTSVTDVEDAAYDPDDRVLYCVREEKHGGQRTWTLALTDDLGATWAVEEIKLNTNSYEFRDLPDRNKALFAVDGALFFNAEVESNGERYEAAVVKRTGPPGAGVYELVFFSNISRYFRDIRALAFKDERNGMVLGQETSVVYDDPDWVLEIVTGQEYYVFDLAVAGPNGYWAIIDPGVQPQLLYHP
jgi:hypothetical protein